ncbi:MAG TPA: ABC transporter permease [Solirubrobacteraceae bacterium]|jgi:ABC-type dipeptide/oligopeptide/nickel transport system permease subunit|nr:ABC transporter permease [Solirubrobacteraceae bacterium]
MSVGSDLLADATASVEGLPGDGLIHTSGSEIAALSPLQLFWRRFRQDRVALISLGFIAFLILVAIFAPLIVKLVGAPAPYASDPSAHDQFGDPTGPSPHALLPFFAVAIGAVLAVLSRYLPWPAIRRRAWAIIAGAGLILAIALAIKYWPHARHIFGVDRGYRDVFSRVLYGARVSLEVAIIATGISMIIGVTLGMVAGYFRGAVDMTISRLIDTLLAFPILLLAIGLASACKLGSGCVGGLIQPGLTTVIAVIAFVNWTYIARIVRGQVLSMREKEFIDASRSLGASDPRIIFREILPNLVAPIIVYASLLIPTNVLFEASLSYLGVGVSFPTASWGAMLSDATDIFATAWWYMLFPGLALLLTVLAFNLLGDGLQDALDPRGDRS